MHRYYYVRDNLDNLEKLATKQEITNLLDNKEQKENEGTVIDIGDHKPNNNTTK